jgi:hypothetical protein
MSFGGELRFNPPTTRTPLLQSCGIVALVFNYSLNGLFADEGTDFYKFSFELLDTQGARIGTSRRCGYGLP